MLKKYSLLIAGVVFLFSAAAQAATVSGQIKFAGQAPQQDEVFMDADPFCMMSHEAAVMDEAVVVNENGTLKNVFVYVKAGLEGKTFPVPATPAVIDQKGCMYEPHVLGMQAGQDLEIVNSDETLHNVHALGQVNKEFNLGMPIQGMRLKKKIEQPEVMMKMKCDVHPWMGSYVGVVAHPFFAVSDVSGKFEIKDLPAGKYTVEAWHEKFGVVTQEIEVAADAAAVDFEYKG